QAAAPRTAGPDRHGSRCAFCSSDVATTGGPRDRAAPTDIRGEPLSGPPTHRRSACRGPIAVSAAPSLSLGLQSWLIAAGGVALWLLLRLVWRLAQLVPLAEAQRRRLSRLGPPLAAIIVVTYTVFAARLQLARLQGT